VITTLELEIPCVGNLEFGNFEVVRVQNQADEAATFQQLCHEVDAVLVIAPETGGILAQRCRQVRGAPTVSWNCTPEAIELCGDKLRMADHLQGAGLPTIPTQLMDFARPPREWTTPLVLKPRDGAGSCLTFLIRNRLEWNHAVHSYQTANASENGLLQPFIAGKALSVGINLSLDGKQRECLPVGEQFLSADGRFQYLGGRIPAEISSAIAAEVCELALAVCQSIEGLAGYIGLDLILTDEGDIRVVEVNPRLTTSYIGYRQLYNGILPQEWLTGTDLLAKRGWKSGGVDFRSTSNE
jgi:predicted ATP-grasp superfamily ATP-dependent carboligase